MVIWIDSNDTPNDNGGGGRFLWFQRNKEPEDYINQDTPSAKE